jgi:hypothetical protein
MKQKILLRQVLAILISWFGVTYLAAQTKVYDSTDPANKRVYAYEGFDYYSNTFRQASGTGQRPSSRDVGNVNTLDVTGPPARSSRYDVRQTVAATPSLTPLSLHNINTSNGEVSNSAFALGWAGDWLGNGSSPYVVSNRVANTTINSPAPAETFSLVNVGFYAVGGGGNTIGRRLQTSTAGYFYEYEIYQEVNQTNNAPDIAYTNDFYFRGGVGSGNNNDERFSRTLGTSPIRLLGGGQAHHRRSAGGTYTTNTALGSAGSTIWFGFLVRINSADPSGTPIANPNQDAYIRLHRDAQVWNANPTTKICIGYLPNTADGIPFGTGATRKWGLYINDQAYVGTGTAPADSSLIKPDQFTLLVTKIEYITETNAQVSLYVINNNSTYYGEDATNTIADAFANVINVPRDPVAVANVTGVDLSFHSVAYQGGSTFGFSNIDELRFARTYDQAALATQTISVLRDLCESGIDVDGNGTIDKPGGTPGLNVNTGGDLGSIASASVGSIDATEQLGSNSPYDEVYEPVNGAPYPVVAPLNPATDNPSPYSPTPPVFIGTMGNPNFSDATQIRSRVVFERAATSFNGVTYGTLAPMFLYRPNQSGMPNDGSYYVGNQSRSPFGGGNDWVDYNGDGIQTSDEVIFRPIWLTVYDNSGSQLGNMMVVNAAYSRGEFFQQTVSGICDGTQYEFYCDIINLFNANTKSITNLANHNNAALGLNDYECSYRHDLEPGASQFAFPGTDLNGNSGLGAATRGMGGTNTCGALNPEIEILLDGVPVYIPPITIANDEKWHRIGFTFVTKAIPSGNITVSVRNRAPGGNGNDLAIDNFIFRPCGPSLELNNPSFCPSTDPSSPTYTESRTVKYTPTGKTYRKPYYLWIVRKCIANCSSTNPNNRTYDPTDLSVTTTAVFDPDDAQITLDDIMNAPGFAALFPTGEIPVGSVVFAYSASENDGNTRTDRCRIVGQPSSFNCLVTLPTSLLEFKARLESSGSVRLDWKTLKEDNVGEFIVERSVDGQTYEAIGRVTAKKTGNTIHTYYFNDYNPVEGTSYYRLKMVDSDDSFEYSNIETIQIKAKYMVHPIPADDKLMVSLAEESTGLKKLKITIYSILGKPLVSGNYEVGYGQQTVVLPVSSLSPGVYVVEIVDGSVKVQKQIIINR